MITAASKKNGSSTNPAKQPNDRKIRQTRRSTPKRDILVHNPIKIDSNKWQ